MQIVITLLVSVITSTAQQLHSDPRFLAPVPSFRVVKFDDILVKRIDQEIHRSRSHHKHRARRVERKLHGIEPLRVNVVRFPRLRTERLNVAKVEAKPGLSLLNRRPVAMHWTGLDRREKNILPFQSYDSGSMLPFVSPHNEFPPVVHSVLHPAMKVVKMEAEPRSDTQPTRSPTEATESRIQTTERLSEQTQHVSGTTKQVSGTTKHVSGTTKQVSGTTKQVSGTTKQVSETTKHVSVTTKRGTGTAKSYTWKTKSTTVKRKKTKGTSPTTTMSTLGPEDSDYYIEYHGWLTVPGYPTPDYWKLEAARSSYEQFAVFFGLGRPKHQLQIQGQIGQIRPIPRPRKPLPYKKPFITAKPKKPK